MRACSAMNAVSGIPGVLTLYLLAPSSGPALSDVPHRLAHVELAPRRLRNPAIVRATASSRSLFVLPSLKSQRADALNSSCSPSPPSINEARAPGELLL